MKRRRATSNEEFFERELKKYARIKDGKIEDVNWEGLSEINNKREGNEQIYEGLINLLKDKGIIITPKQNTYLVFGCGMILSPDHYQGNMGFTRKKDAEEYKKAFYGGARYDTYIAKVE
ncbi:MAG: hypothetical protein WC781_01400 [Candidatus Pacearchaeota archaeon]|jgi:hypothetical protein